MTRLKSWNFAANCRGLPAKTGQVFGKSYAEKLAEQSGGNGEQISACVPYLCCRKYMNHETCYPSRVPLFGALFA